MGELFHFQAAICWPLAVMTATVCRSMIRIRPPFSADTMWAVSAKF